MFEYQALKDYAYANYGWVGPDGTFKPTSFTSRLRKKQSGMENCEEEEIPTKVSSPNKNERSRKRDKKRDNKKERKKPKRTIIRRNQSSSIIEQKESADMNDVLSKIPEEVKADFNRIGLVKDKNGNNYNTVIQVNPYEFPNHYIMNEWQKMYHEWRNEGKNGDFKRLVYWYGQKHNEENVENDEDDNDLSLVNANIIHVLNEQGLDPPLPNDGDLNSIDFQFFKEVCLEPHARISQIRKIQEKKQLWMDKIPLSNSVDFHKVGFYKKYKTFYPAIQLSPFEVNTKTRKKYFKEVVKEYNRGDKKTQMKRLVFIYGTKLDNKNNAFEFVAESNFVAFDSCNAQYKHFQIPKAIKDKIFDDRETLSSDEELFVHGRMKLLKESTLPAAARGIDLFIPNDVEIFESYAKVCHFTEQQF